MFKKLDDLEGLHLSLSSIDNLHTIYLSTATACIRLSDLTLTSEEQGVLQRAVERNILTELSRLDAVKSQIAEKISKHI